MKLIFKPYLVANSPSPLGVAVKALPPHTDTLCHWLCSSPEAFTPQTLGSAWTTYGFSSILPSLLVHRTTKEEISTGGLDGATL